MSKEETPKQPFVVTDRRRAGGTTTGNNGGDRSDRRLGDRRKKAIPVAVERRGGDERRLVGERRRQIDPTTCERDYSDDEVQFMKTMDQYKRDNRRPFPTWSEVLEVLFALGYRKVAEATPIPGSAEALAIKKKEG